MTLAVLCGVCLALLGSHRLNAENWPHWRGPAFNGATSEKGLPESFSKTENVRWSAPMPGPAAATPIIWGDHVFISSVDDENKRSSHVPGPRGRTGAMAA